MKTFIDCSIFCVYDVLNKETNINLQILTKKKYNFITNTQSHCITDMHNNLL